MEINLSHRRAVVCGSSQGIGRAAAVELASLGANITLLARNRERLEAVIPELDVSSGQSHSLIVADFSDADQVRDAIGQFVDEGNVAEILINNTGGPPGGTAMDAATDEFKVAFESHLLCNQTLVQALLPGMKSQGYGRIINVISTSVKQPIPGLGVSNTIRGAVASWAKTLATELGPFGITVNNLLPGMTQTARLDSIIASRAEASGQTVGQVAETMQAAIPARRFAEATEIAAAIAFLASPAASYVNGINLPVDGGRTQCL
ncbi:MAG: SDR family oxidoreductase [Mariniblastus sp.]|nr:SDR family oxidoreductase [Mariniblastus sp.]